MGATDAASKPHGRGVAHACARSLPLACQVPATPPAPLAPPRLALTPAPPCSPWLPELLCFGLATPLPRTPRITSPGRPCLPGQPLQPPATRAAARNPFHHVACPAPPTRPHPHPTPPHPTPPRSPRLHEPLVLRLGLLRDGQHPSVWRGGRAPALPVLPLLHVPHHRAG